MSNIFQTFPTNNYGAIKVFTVNYCFYYFFFSDINECVRGTHNCPKPVVGVCTNTIGSFTCSCIKGYELKGNQCQGIHLNQLKYIMAYI